MALADTSSDDSGTRHASNRPRRFIASFDAPTFHAARAPAHQPAGRGSSFVSRTPSTTRRRFQQIAAALADKATFTWYYCDELLKLLRHWAAEFVPRHKLRARSLAYLTARGCRRIFAPPQRLQPDRHLLGPRRTTRCGRRRHDGARPEEVADPQGHDLQDGQHRYHLARGHVVDHRFRHAYNQLFVTATDTAPVHAQGHPGRNRRHRRPQLR